MNKSNQNKQNVQFEMNLGSKSLNGIKGELADIIAKLQNVNSKLYDIRKRSIVAYRILTNPHSIVKSRCKKPKKN